MGKQSQSEASKITLLHLIKEHKSILFGKLTPIVTREVKNIYWNIVLDKAKSVQLVAEDKPVKHVRDITWGNWKKRYLEKRDKRNKTSEEGGYEVMNSEAEDLIEQILGKDSPVINGLCVRESMDLHTPKPVVPSSEAPLASHSSQFVSTQQTSSKSTNSSSKKRFIRKLYHEKELVSKKLKLTVDLMEIDKRTKLINLYDLEKKHGFPHCELTRNLTKDLILTNKMKKEVLKPPNLILKQMSYLNH